MTIGGLSQTIKARDLGLGVGDSGLRETRLSIARANESPAARRPVSTPNRRAAGASSSSRLRSNRTVGMPRRSSCSAAVAFGPERYSTTRSGRRAGTAPPFWGMPSPPLGTASAAGGGAHPAGPPPRRAPPPAGERTPRQEGRTPPRRRAGAAGG